MCIRALSWINTLMPAGRRRKQDLSAPWFSLCSIYFPVYWRGCTGDVHTHQHDKHYSTLHPGVCLTGLTPSLFKSRNGSSCSKALLDVLTICSWLCGEPVAPFKIHCKFCSPMTMLDCRMAVFGEGVMVIVGLLVKTGFAATGTVWTTAGRGSAALGAVEAGAPATTDSPCTKGCGGGWVCCRKSWWPAANGVLWGTGTSGDCKAVAGFPNAAGWELGAMEEGAAGAAEPCSAAWAGSGRPSCRTRGRDNEAASPAGGGTAATESASPLNPSIKGAAERETHKTELHLFSLGLNKLLFQWT